MNNYKVCILAAGIGSRMEKFTKTFNKALIPLRGKPAICHIIEKFPNYIEIVIPVGYKKETVIDYLKHAYPDRKITFIEVDKYTGRGAGPGYSLLQCKNHLQCPFIFFSADTLVKESIPLPSENWFGLAKVNDTSRFCSAKTDGERIIRIDDKIKTDNKFAFIGLAGVNDFQYFWHALETNRNLISEELQVSNGFISLLEKDLKAKIFTWFDTGTLKAYEYALQNYPHGEGYVGE